jgi:phosphatidylglycerophosphatase A
MSFFSPITLFVTFFWVGKLPIMPGTFGSIAAIMLSSFIFISTKDLGININWLFVIYPIIIYFIYIAGLTYSDIYATKLRKKDPQEIVIDEVVGMMLCMYIFAILYSILVFIKKDYFETLLVLFKYYIFLNFLIFRLFDIAKPGKIRKAQELRNKGRSVMLDDVWAGIYASITSIVLFLVFYMLGIWKFILTSQYPLYLERLGG